MEESKEIFIVDKLVIGNNHIVFNSGFISVISEIYPEYNIRFYSEYKHAKALKDKLKNLENLTIEIYYERPLPIGLKKIIPWFKKKIKDIFFIKFFYKENFIKAKMFIFTTLSVTSIYYANIYARRIKNIPVYIVLHGEIEFLFRKHIRFLDKLKKIIYLKFIKNLSENVNIIVLSEVVKNELMKNFSIPSYKIIQILHPINYIQNDLITLGNKIILGHIGTAMKKKSSDLFFELASKLKQENLNLNFLQIGKIDSNLLSKVTPEVDLVFHKNKSLSQDIYESTIKTINYAIFTFDDENYVYRDSGAVMDAIAFAKPIIALRQNYFVNLFKLGGDIGFLCNDIYEMELLIKKIAKHENDIISRYSIQYMNMKNLAHFFSLSNIKYLMKEQIQLNG